MPNVHGITFDFYQTLVRHRTGQGRGPALMEYLAGAGLSSAPWEHRILYYAFDFYGREYREDLSAAEEQAFWMEFTERLFDRLQVEGSTAEHTEAVRELLGPNSLVLYDDVLPTLEWLRASGLRRGIVSNWQHGLRHFCRELGIVDYFDFAVVSAEVGFEKPDLQMFQIAAERIGAPAGHILHVGDNPVQDVAAATEFGLQTLHLVREDSTENPSPPVIASLEELRSHIPL